MGPQPGTRRHTSALYIVILLALLTACAPSIQSVNQAPATPSSSASEPTGTAAPRATAMPTLPGWSLIWDSEFSGGALDTTQWQPVNSAVPKTVGCCTQYANQAWGPRNVTVKNGSLHLITTNQPSGAYPYTSGAVNTIGKFSFTYGRVDIRAKLSTTEGLWPAAWLLPVSSTRLGRSEYEIDVIEAWGSQPTTVHFFFHWPGDQQGCIANGPNYALGYHVYTLIWTSKLIEWQVDGATRCLATNGIPQMPMYLILSAAVDGSLERTNGSTILPQSFDIDYVRVWRASS